MDSTKLSPPQEAKLHFLDYWRIIRIRKTVIIAVFLLVVITATVVTFLLPEQYAGKARVSVHQENPDIQPVSQGTAYYPQGIDPFYIQTEFEVMQSQEVLDRVIETNHLREHWGVKLNSGDPLPPELTRQQLKKNIRLSPEHNTSIIDIIVYSDTAKEAAELANSIAEEYKQYREEKNKEKMERGLKALREDMEKQEKELADAQTNVDQLRISLKVDDQDPQSTTPNPTISAAIIQQIQSEVIRAEGEKVKLETQLGKLEPLSKADLRGAIQTVVEPDTILNNLLSEHDLAQQTLLKLSKSVTEAHPDYVNAKQQVDELDAKIDDRVDKMMFGLKTRLATIDAYLAKEREILDDAKKTDLENDARTRPYWVAKQNLNDKRMFMTTMAMKISSLEADLKLPRETMVEILDKQTEPNLTAVKPNKPLTITLGVIVGLIVGIGLAFFIEYLDTSVKTIDDIERSLQAPVLGVIPQNVGFLLTEGAESPHAEAYRVLRTNLLFSRKEEKLNSIAVVSAGAGEGKSTTVFNLATVFAQNGSRVVIVDSDLRRPTLHKMLGVANNIGLTNYLLKQNLLEEVIQTTNLPTLDFMASGKLPSSSLGILSSSQMKDLITELKRRYDFVFFDSPPIMGVSDASILASEVDMTLQVIQYRRYPQPMNIRAKQMIEKVGGNLVGIVLNNINVSQDENYYYYSGYYNEYYSKNEEETAAASGTGSGDKSKTDIKPKY